MCLNSWYAPTREEASKATVERVYKVLRYDVATGGLYSPFVGYLKAEKMKWVREGQVRDPRPLWHAPRTSGGYRPPIEEGGLHFYRSAEGAERGAGGRGDRVIVKYYVRSDDVLAYGYNSMDSSSGVVARRCFSSADVAKRARPWRKPSPAKKAGPAKKSKKRK